MEEYAYREAVGEEIESPARRVDYCLAWLRDEFPESTAAVLHGPDELVADSPNGEHLVGVQHTFDRQFPGMLEGIVEETGCEVVSTHEQYRTELDAVETLVWIAPANADDEYDEDALADLTDAWEAGEFLVDGHSLAQAKRDVLVSTVLFGLAAGLAVVEWTFDVSSLPPGGAGSLLGSAIDVGTFLVLLVGTLRLAWHVNRFGRVWWARR